MGRPNRRAEANRRAASRMAGVGSDSDSISRAQLDLIEHWGAHPYNFLTGVDLDGRPIYWTKDEANRSAPIRPFPTDKLYIKIYCDIMFRERLVWTDKARQMYISTSTMGYCLWRIMFQRARRILLSKNTEDESKEMLKDKVRFPYSQLPEWLKSFIPVDDKPAGIVTCKKNHSYILGVAENVADRECRGGGASTMVVDEAARQGEYASIMQGALPMADQIFSITTPEIGNAGAEAFKRYIDDKGMEEFINLRILDEGRVGQARGERVDRTGKLDLEMSELPE